MFLNPEYIRTFAQTARRSLQNPEVTHPRVLLLRLRDRRSGFQNRRHSSTSGKVIQNVIANDNVGEVAGNERGRIILSTPADSQPVKDHPILLKRTQPLPTSCPGCGALAQESEPEEAGFYSRSRKAVKAYFKSLNKEDSSQQGQSTTKEDEDQRTTGHQQNDHEIDDAEPSVIDASSPVPMCERCHNLIHNASGKSIAHPSMEDLADSIAESPFRRNHIYHVLDAADFPMSLIPSIYKRLELAKPRGQNRRSQHGISHKPTLSFIITRSDLLGRNKEVVDTLMPYFRSTLRAALGRTGEGMRLGNVHLVSAKRGWWTKDIKDNIWNQGGGNWLLGKFNVGKSNLFEVLFPKGSGERAPVYAELSQQQSREEAELLPNDNDLLSESSLLPPPQPERRFPVLPLVSSLPGTTASPIRLPFGNHRGELIDLPGLARGNLEQHVLSDHQKDLVMTHRPTVVQHNIKPGQSLLLGGGLIRLTPVLDENDPSTIVMAYPFVPIEAHVTSTEKAIKLQSQERDIGIASIVGDGVASKIRSAGTRRLDTDITKRRAGPLLRAGVPLSRLPFQVFSTDILIEGVGWVELVCQTRRHRRPIMTQDPKSQMDDDIVEEKVSERMDSVSAGDSKRSTVLPDRRTEHNDETQYPTIEIFSPDGKHIGQRPPLGAWDWWNRANKHNTGTTSGTRPRKSMKGMKKREKIERRTMDK